MNERKWIDIEPGESSLSANENFEESNQSLLRQSHKTQREDDGAVHFW